MKAMANSPDRQLVIVTDEIFRADLARWLPEALVFSFGSTPEEVRKNVVSWREQGYQNFLLLYNPVETPTENLIVTDHINLTHENPLIGPQEAILGSRFPDMSAVYAEASSNGAIVTMGSSKAFSTFREKTWPVHAGIYEAIALKASGATVRGRVVSKLEDLYTEILNLTEV
ncbi:MAG: hypothetical protein AUJ47_03080 [Candidatus Marinimicrobia bacterium CG1_02_48_14]|nr:MAG: hypothetical protein AUJ47_03080 [Candidatus Marinimicrobia bacterium CG1_02_48_14]PJA52239.1 MAG: hypothetical protein CO167_09580 [Candidatus Marinimicrobia bacterium CG_4_9_14_3_um_filter_48_9]